MDKIDEKILHELDNNPRITSAQLGKKLRISQQVADYRIKRFQKEDIIHSFATVINPMALGYQIFNVLLTYDSFPEKRKIEFLKYMQNHNNVFYAAIIGGKYDVLATFIAKNYAELDFVLNDIFEKFNNCFLDYEVFPIIMLHQYKYSHIKGKQNLEFNAINQMPNVCKLTKKDYQLLHFMKNDARISYLELAKKVKMSYPTIKKRISDLKKNEIIVGNKIFIRPIKLGLKAYNVLLSVKNYSKQKENTLFAYANAHKNIMFAYKLVGGIWTFNLGLEVESFEKVQEVVGDLRKNFPLIDDFHILPVFKDIRIDHFPTSSEYI